jgi:acyl-CoA thioesterase
MSTHPFVAATSWAEDQVEPKRGTIDPAWYQGRGAYGGIVAALLLKGSQTRIVERDRIPRSLTVHFPLAAEQGAIELHTALERDGKRISHTTARLIQNNETVAFSTTTFAKKREHAVSYARAQMPRVPPPEQTRLMRDNMLAPVFTQFFDISYCIGSPPFSGADTPELGGWIAPRQPLLCDAALAVALLDAWPPAAMSMSTGPMLAASVDFTVHFFEALPLANATPGDRYLVHVRSKIAKDGYSEELRELWSRDGVLLAQCRQLFAMF